MQGVVRFFDPQTGEGVIISDTADRTEYAVAKDALEGSIFVTLRQGQRVNFELNGAGRATSVRFGSEADMGLPTAQV